jgi:anaerobic magnesium-protoporphyrin IX monomethyl ester cyclase
MRIALVSAAYNLVEYRSGESLGLKYLASTLRQAGYSTEIFELAGNDGSTELWLSRVENEEFDLIGFGVLFTKGLDETLRLATETRHRAPRAHITIGGQGTSFVWADILEACAAIDSAVCFEGDLTIVYLAWAVEMSSGLDSVSGLYHRVDGKTSFTGFRAPVEALDAIPFPVRDRSSKVLGDPHFTMLTSRGCQAHCTFCSSGNFGNRYHDNSRWRARSAANIVAEINELVERHGAQAISFVDDDFLGACEKGPPRAREFISLLARQPYSIKWSIECRVAEVERGLFRDMSHAGLEHVFIGIDAGNEEDLKIFGKGFDLSTSANAVAILRELGLSFRVGFIMFHPESDFRRIRTNLLFLRKNGLGSVLNIINKLEIYVGSPLATYFVRKGLAWRDGFAYDWRYGDSRLNTLQPTLKKILLPMRAVEDQIQRARFRIQTGVGSESVSDPDLGSLRDRIDAADAETRTTILDVADEVVRKVERHSLDMSVRETEVMDVRNLTDQIQDAAVHIRAQLADLT